jgi:hypothetical protein
VAEEGSGAAGVVGVGAVAFTCGLVVWIVVITGFFAAIVFAGFLAALRAAGLAPAAFFLGVLLFFAADFGRLTLALRPCVTRFAADFFATVRLRATALPVGRTLADLFGRAPVDLVAAFFVVGRFLVAMFTPSF